MPAISTTLMPIARPAPSNPYNLNAAKTVSSKPPMAPPCNASAKPGRCSRCFQPKTRPTSASTLIPASRSSIGIRIQPWSLAYFNSDATPASNTSMPTLTGTLPSVNQRFTAPATRASGPGPEGTSCACGSNSAGAAVRGGACTALRAADDAGASAGNDGGTGSGATSVGVGAACRSAARGSSGSPYAGMPTSDVSCGSHAPSGDGDGVGADLCTAAASAPAAPLACHCASRCSSASTRRRSLAIHTRAITSPTGTASSNSTTVTIIVSNAQPLSRHPAECANHTGSGRVWAADHWLKRSDAMPSVPPTHTGYRHGHALQKKRPEEPGV